MDNIVYDDLKYALYSIIPGKWNIDIRADTCTATCWTHVVIVVNFKVVDIPRIIKDPRNLCLR